MDWKKIRQTDWHRLLNINYKIFLVRYRGITYLACLDRVNTKCKKKGDRCDKLHCHCLEVIKMIGFNNMYSKKTTQVRLDVIIKSDLKKGNHFNIEYKFLDSAVTPEAITAKACECHSTHVSHEERLHEVLYGKFHDDGCRCEYAEDFLKSVPQGGRIDFY